MRDFRHTIYILIMKLPPIRSLQPIQDSILEIMRREVEQEKQDLQRLRWQANQAHMELQKDLGDPDCPPEKKEELRKIDQRLVELLGDYAVMSRFQIPDE